MIILILSLMFLIALSVTIIKVELDSYYPNEDTIKLMYIVGSASGFILALITVFEVLF